MTTGRAMPSLTYDRCELSCRTNLKPAARNTRSRRCQGTGVIRGMLRLNRENFLLLLDDLRGYPFAAFKAVTALFEHVIECAMLPGRGDKKLNGFAKRAASGESPELATSSIRACGM